MKTQIFNKWSMTSKVIEGHIKPSYNFKLKVNIPTTINIPVFLLSLRDWLIVSIAANSPAF